MHCWQKHLSILVPQGISESNLLLFLKCAKTSEAECDGVNIDDQQVRILKSSSLGELISEH